MDVLLHGSYRRRVYVLARTNTSVSCLPEVLVLKVASFILTEPAIRSQIKQCSKNVLGFGVSRGERGEGALRKPP